jgi:zinc D-Ala-D-Ala carboxypeptidase
MLLPSGKNVTSSTQIYPGSHFTWGEATKDCSRAIENLVVKGRLALIALDVEKKIVATAIELDKVRSILGDRPLHVNSWYRPNSVNKSVGGASDSRHQYGDAVDIRSNYLSPQDIYRLLDKIHVRGGMGRYYSFVHLDFRGEQARWCG